MRTNFHRQDTQKHCVPEYEVDWQNRDQKTKLCGEKKRKQPCGSLKGAIPSDEETLEAAVSPICAMSGMHSYFLSEQRDNVNKPLRHLTFLLVSLFIAKQCDSLGFFLKVESCEKKIQALGSDIKRWHSHPCDCLEKGWGYVCFVVVPTSSSAPSYMQDSSLMIAQESNLGQTRENIGVLVFVPELYSALEQAQHMPSPFKVIWVAGETVEHDRFQ